MLLTKLRLLQDTHCHSVGGWAGMRQKYLKSFSQTASEALSKVSLQIHEIKDSTVLLKSSLFIKRVRTFLKSKFNLVLHV